nr:5255 [Craspedostauros australis]
MNVKTLLGSLVLSQIGSNAVHGMFDTVSDAGGSNSEPCPLDYQLLRSSDFQYSGAPIEIVSQDTSSVSFKVYNVWPQDGRPTAEIYTEYSENNSIGGVNCEMFANVPANQDVGETFTAQCFQTKPKSVVTLYVRDPDIDKTIGTGKVPQCCHADLSIQYAVLKFTYVLECVPTCEDPTPFSSCGDGTVDPGEECDDGNKINDDSCTNQCTSAKCGDGIMQSGEECDDGNKVDNDGCTNGCKLPKCGDGFMQAGEECDDGNAVNNDGCTNGCKLPTCGDGIVQNGEECDDGNAVNNDGCTNTCKNAKCGDGIMQAGEECDDGNAVNNDGCTNGCKLPTCGDGIVQNGEECDDGNNSNTDSCTNNCKNAKCGDGIMQAGEECDDGNAVNNDGCTNGCKLPTCGDGIVQNGEECDDGNNSNTDSCTNTCKNAKCGDGFMQAGEECDDGNAVNNDGCTNGCKLPTCGDGIVQNGEECDDGNNSNTDSCTNNCKNAKCGDGFMQAGEECDDGNNSNTDGCTNGCKLPKCGDGIVQNGEECDDGNNNNNDNCTNNCEIPVPNTCGNGIVDPGEECDEGTRNDYSGTRCKPDCTLPPGVCPLITLDFNDLPDGGFIYDEWWNTKGVKIIAASSSSRAYTPRPTSKCKTGELGCYCSFNPNYPLQCSNWRSDKSYGAARVFDTSKPTGYRTSDSKYALYNNPMCDPRRSGDHGDPDLGSPNEGCPNPGPGVGREGAPLKRNGGVNKFANCPATPIGKVLVIQEDKKTCPDDIGKPGGCIYFIFRSSMHGAVKIEMGRFLDIDNNEDRPKMQFYHPNRSSPNQSLTRYADKSGHNGLTDLWLSHSNIYKTSVSYNGSGCIAELRFRPSKCPSRRLRGQSAWDSDLAEDELEAEFNEEIDEIDEIEEEWMMANLA